MSKEILSPSTATVMSRGQIGNFQDLLGHGLIKSKVLGSATPSQVEEFLKTAGTDLRDTWVQIAEHYFEHYFQAFTGRYLILVNYDEPDAIAKTIEENSFGYKYVNVKPANIPLGGKGEAVEQVHEVHFGKVMYNRDLPAALKARGVELGFPLGFKFANPLTSLRYANKFPKKQLQEPRGILFYNTGGQLCYLFLFEADGKRRLNVDRNPDPGFWREDVRFLVVPEVQPLVA